jgi:Raf kinase inhibitor-like YbhB/YbcL family protein
MIDFMKESILKFEHRFPLAVRALAQALLGLILASIYGSSGAQDAFTVSSTVMRHGATLPKRFAGQGGPRNCDGNNVSPPIRWSNPPKGTRSFIVAITDLDGLGEPNGAGFIHSLVYDIPGSVRQLDEGWASTASSKYKVGTNTLGRQGYDGPCPHAGKEGPHKYGISVTAISLEPGTLKPGMRLGPLFDAVGKYLLNSNDFEVVYPSPAK